MFNFAFSVLLILSYCFLIIAQYQYKNRGWSIEHWPMNTDASEQCADCQEYFMRNADIWTNDTAISQVLSNLDAECKSDYPVSDVFKRKLCEYVASVIVQIPPDVLDGMYSLSWPIPEGICSLFLQCSVDCCFDHNQPPSQVHLAFTSRTDMYGVSWVTFNQNISVVQYGTNPNELTMSNKGNIRTYVVGNWKGTIHRAKMTNLLPGQIYYYRVGNGHDSWSQIFRFKTLMPLQDEVTLAILGDMDFEANITMANIGSLAQSGAIDGVIILGDESYADGYMPHWDRFFERCEQFAAYVPFMATPGNHEFWYNFTAYKNRFYSPSCDDEGSGSGDNMFYSFNVGHAHFMCSNSESAVDTADYSEAYLEWFQKDASAVDRSSYPFLVSYQHRPIYCSSNGECANLNGKEGILLQNRGEDLFIDNKVNLILAGHVHSYERTFPMAKTAATQLNYLNPSAPVHITQGASGNRESNTGFPSSLPDWSAFQSPEIGYALMKIKKETIDWSFWVAREDSQGGPYQIDSFTLTPWN